MRLYVWITENRHWWHTVLVIVNPLGGRHYTTTTAMEVVDRNINSNSYVITTSGTAVVSQQKLLLRLSRSTGSVTYSASTSRDGVSTCGAGDSVLCARCSFVVWIIALACWNACANVSSQKFIWVRVTVVTVWNWRPVVCGRFSRLRRSYSR